MKVKSLGIDKQRTDGAYDDDDAEDDEDGVDDEDGDEDEDGDDEDEHWSGIKGVIDERKTDGKMITVLAYIGV